MKLVFSFSFSPCYTFCFKELSKRISEGIQVMEASTEVRMAS